MAVLPIPSAALPSPLNDAVQELRLLPLPSLRELKLGQVPRYTTTVCTVKNQDGKLSCAVLLVMVSKKLLLKAREEETARAAGSVDTVGAGAARAAGAGGAVFVGKGLDPMEQVGEDARWGGAAHIVGAPVAGRGGLDRRWAQVGLLRDGWGWRQWRRWR